MNNFDGVVDKVSMGFTAKVSDSKIQGFLGSFESKTNESVAIKLDDIMNQARLLKNDLDSKDINIPNEDGIKIYLDKASKIIEENRKDPIKGALAIGLSFGSAFKVNRVNLFGNQVVKDRVSQIIYDYIDIAKISSDAKIRGLAIDMAENFTTESHVPSRGFVQAVKQPEFKSTYSNFPKPTSKDIQ